MRRNIITIDAEGQTVGRLSTKIATILIGKHKVGWRPHIDSGDIVTVTNANQLKLTGKKVEQKKYFRYSGYPGGIKEKKASDLMQQNPAEVLRRSVRSMLPKNTHLITRMKRLKFQ